MLILPDFNSVIQVGDYLFISFSHSCYRFCVVGKFPNKLEIFPLKLCRKHNSSKTSGRSSKPSTYCRRGFPEDLRLDSQNLRINIPARSAPGSCLPTPPVSPRKSAHQESFASKSEVPPTFRRLSDSEIPTQTLSRFLSHVYPDSTMKSCHYPDHSPLPSPTATRSHPNPSSPKGISCSFYQYKSLSEANISAHPLPLPPGALHCQSSSSLSPGIESSDVPSLKGQWNKGKLIGRGTFGSVYVAANR